MKQLQYDLITDAKHYTDKDVKDIFIKMTQDNKAIFKDYTKYIETAYSVDSPLWGSSINGDGIISAYAKLYHNYNIIRLYINGNYDSKVLFNQCHYFEDIDITIKYVVDCFNLYAEWLNSSFKIMRHTIEGTDKKFVHFSDTTKQNYDNVILPRYQQYFREV